ncbi:MAG: ABC transporter permease [Bacteroidota bacterium]
MQRVLFNFLLALEGVFSNQLRAFLTALGIIFGVAAVITMLAIGTGAKQSILEQMKLIGTNNIVITSVVPSEAEDNEQGGNNEEKIKWSPGLTLEDVKTMIKTLPTLDKASPEMEIKTNIIQSGKLEKAKAIGVTNAFFELNNLKLSTGQFFHQEHLDKGKAVCIIGKSIQRKFFSDENPVGQKIKCGNTWLNIIGVLERRNASQEDLESLGIRDYNSDVYMPISTALLRFKNRALVTRDDIKRGDWDDGEKGENYHQLDKVTLRVSDAAKIIATRDLVGKILKRRHKIVDYEIRVPEKELEAQRESQETWNSVLAFIAGISLLVGGIGIMNIMLATVMERIKEIGVRRSLGAKRNDIVLQFLFEAIFISLIGGIIGVVLGVGAAKFIAANYDIPTIIPIWAVLLSFVVAVSVGIIFGIFPAQKAAQQDPIKALRTD